MNNINEIIKKIKDGSNNLRLINEILIDLSKDPNIEHLKVVDYLIENLNKEEGKKININLIYLIGEIGKKIPLTEKHIKYLVETFYNSDRWIRSEVINAIEKNIEIMKSNRHIHQIINIALSDEYEINKINGLKLILELDGLASTVLKSFLIILNNSEPNLIDYINKVLSVQFRDKTILFERLNSNDNYKILTKHGMRTIVQSFIDSVESLKTFRNLIEDSHWDKPYISLFLKEIDIFNHLLTNREV